MDISTLHEAARSWMTHDPDPQTRGELQALLAAGDVVPPITSRFPLDRAAEAHRALEGRETTGATVLLP